MSSVTNKEQVEFLKQMFSNVEVSEIEEALVISDFDVEQTVSYILAIQIQEQDKTQETRETQITSIEKNDLKFEENYEDQDGWVCLPEDLTYLVFTFLDVESLSVTATVCKKWRRIAADPILWRKIYLKRWCIENTLSNQPEIKQDWKQLYWEKLHEFMKTRNFNLVKGLSIWSYYGEERAVAFLQSTGQELDNSEIELLRDYFHQNPNQSAIKASAIFKKFN
eukprot:TRINITY_DN1242_c1_g7_i1.p1 TRINITY_DN1242_c1_g7~~TRINITY_DN1242_c1_g7_i1.p1  ORF type:complete len:223 (-),score=84.80 TRINITY_DN1242_c1_g7_i1:22-690(-)